MCKNITDSWKYIISAAVSTIVVIRGLAIIAGSIFKDLATSGKTPPITFAIIMVKNILIATISDVSKPDFVK